ncbi:hypothetical protein JVU11DRAFT_9169 [Chiua virens]|nr:hypothetical protein JVU11DRAFT_9169 [Chiua virens]
MTSLFKKNTIREWQDRMDASRFMEKARAVCAWSFPQRDLVALSPTSAMLTVLRNDCIPRDLLPSTYDVEAYSQAILCPEGLSNVHALAAFQVYSQCRRSLQASPPRQPLFSLANFKYYARDRLPPEVAHAFDTASPFDLALISRCRASKVTHHFIRRGARGGYIPEESSQRFNRGNVAIFPQDINSLRNVLPPEPDDLEEIRAYTGMQIQGGNNEWYQTDDVQYSEQNMRRLFPSADYGSDYGLLDCLQAEHSSGGKESEIHEFDWNDDQYAIVMDNVAYTLGDHSPQSRDMMKAHALAYALDQKRFIRSQAGSSFINDIDVGFLSYLFPHLDPWGIGGFNHPGRAKNQRISFSAQLT